MRHSGGDSDERARLERFPILADQQFGVPFEDHENLVICPMAMGADTGLTGLKDPFRDAVGSTRFSLVCLEQGGELSHYVAPSTPTGSSITFLAVDCGSSPAMVTPCFSHASGDVYHNGPF